MKSEQSGAATVQTARVAQSPFGNSEVAALLTTHQGLESSLGVAVDWSPPLRMTVAIALAAPFPTFVAWGSELTLVYNDAARLLLGARHPHVLGQSLQVLFADHWNEIEPLIGMALAGEHGAYPSFHFMAFAQERAEGVWCNLSFSPARDDQGKIQGIYVVCGEITSQAQQRGASSESELRYRTLFDSMDEGFCIIEFFDGPEGPLSDYIHIEANAAYALHAGIPNVVGQRLREMVGAEAQGWVDLYGSVLRTGTPIRFERELVATARHLELAAFRIEPAERKQVAVLFQDITARKRAELALQENNATLELRVAHALAERKLLAEVVEGTNAFVHVLDQRMRWLAINSAAAYEFEKVFGVLPKVGDDMLELLATQPAQQAAVRALWSRAMAGEEFVEIAQFGELSPERAFYEMRFSTLRDANGQQIGAYQFVYDVTARIEEQQRLREAEEALRQSQKMEAVGQLTGGIAHDFNNLLAGISGAFEMIATRLAQGRVSDVERYLASGQGATRRAAALTHRLLAFSRRQTLSPKATVINRLMVDLVELVRRTVGPSIKVEPIAAAGLWTTLVDANQLENAILNLCINARDAMPDGGMITIETGNKWLDARTAKDHGLEPGQYVTICVSDTGTGIDKATLERVFDPFFTTKPLGQGTGLGLSMVYGFARQSHGHVRIYSEVGQGTMVCIYLPRHVGEEQLENVASVDVVTPADVGRSILIVDDEQSIRTLIVDALGETGYAVAEAADGAAGLKILESDQEVDLLITDVGLPGGLNGRQVADAARVMRPKLKVIFITGYAENAVLNHGHVEHGMEVLTKPFSIADLVKRVDRMLEEGPAT